MSGNRRHREFQDWSETGDFLKKPKGGWLHTSDQLNPHAGVCYSATYLGYIDVLESLMGHNCAMRARAVKEAVERLAEETKIHPKMRRRNNDTCGILGKMFAENTDVKFILKYNTLDTLALQTDKKLASHDISEISYVSGEETIPGELEFVSYVAKHNDHRACYVFECGGELAHDIIATIAQTIEIRYKMLLADQGVIPRPKFTTKIYDVFHICSSKAVRHHAFFAKKGIMFEKKLTKKDQEKMEEKLLSLSFGGGGGSVYDNNTAPVEPEYDFYDNAKGNPDPDPYAYDDAKPGANDSHSFKSREKKKAQVLLLDDPYGDYDNAMHRATQLEYGSASDSIYMKEEMPSHAESAHGKVLTTAPVGQVWFHGKITRQRCEELLHEEGQFIVRESTTAPGQFVLSSYTAGRIRHLILVDQTGMVHANGHVYPSVEELVEVHMNGGPPISSGGLQIVLKEPIGVSEEKC